MSRRAFAIALTAAIVVSLPAIGQTPQKSGDEFPVNSTTYLDQTVPAVGMDDAGNFVVVWRDDGNGSAVMGNRFSAGMPLPAVHGEFQVDTTYPNSWTRPDVSMNGSGQFVVSWGGYDGYNKVPFVLRYDAAGVPAASPLIASTYSSWMSDTRIALDSSGNFVVVWDDFSTVKATRFDATDVKSFSEVTVATASSGMESFDLDVSDGGNFVVVWAEYLSPAQYEVRASIFGPAGSVVAGPLAVNTTTAGDQLSASVAVGPSGNFVVVWEDVSSGAIRAQKFDSAGTKIDSEMSISLSTAYAHLDPSVAYDGKGNFVVAWAAGTYVIAKAGSRSAASLRPAVDGDGLGIATRAFYADGTSSGELAPVNTTTTGDQRAPSVAIGADGRFVIAWQTPAPDFSTDIAAQQLVIACPILGSLSPADGTTGMPVAGAGTVLSWSDSVGADSYDIYLEAGGTCTATTPVATVTGTLAAGTFSYDYGALGLSPNTQYAWSVVANRAGCNPIASACMTFTTTDCPSFTSFSPVSGAVDVPTSGTLSWTTSIAADSYDVYLDLGPSCTSTTPVATGLTTTSYAYSGLTPNTEYAWRVVAKKAGCADVVAVCQTFTTTDCPIFTSFSPTGGASGVGTDGTLSWTVSSPADSFDVYFGPAGTGCSTFFGNSSTTSIAYSGLAGDTTYEWKVVAKKAGCPSVTGSCLQFTTLSLCPGAGPPLYLPANGSTLASPVEFLWGPVAAESYELWVSADGATAGDCATQPSRCTLLAATTDIRFAATLDPGTFNWWVTALPGNGCDPVTSTVFSFTVPDVPPPPPPPPPCGTPVPPLPSVVGEVTTGEMYRVEWTQVEGAASYIVEEATDAAFTSFTTLPETGEAFVVRSHEVTAASPFFYRVRARAACDGTKVSPHSESVRVVVIPKPQSQSDKLNLVTHFGQDDLVHTLLFIPGDEGSGKNAMSGSFTVTSSGSWVTVSPSSGTLPPSGTTVTVTANTSGLPVGTSTTTVSVSTTGTSGSKTTSVPVSVSRVTPVSPSTKKSSPPANALIIPAVAHVEGSNGTEWQSDIRIANVSAETIRYELHFTRTLKDGKLDAKQTTVSVPPGQTIAFDDIVKQWYGLGSLSDGTNGVLEIRPVDTNGKMSLAAASRATVASSRTYNVAAKGTFGQFIPAVLFERFIGKPADVSSRSVLSMQQIAQNEMFRTNFGLVEASGAPASVLLSVFDTTGANVGNFPISLGPWQHMQLNSFLASQGVSLDDGRAEVKVTSDGGRITSYASVVDGRTSDPLLVPGRDLSTLSADKYVIAGVADFENERNVWRSDVRLFNASETPVDATLTFFPQDSASPAGSVNVTIGAGEVRVLNDVVSTLFGGENIGGAIHVTTATPVPLVATARTFDAKGDGTYGQFIPGVTVEEAIGAGESLQILQVEESARFRTNLGLAEVSGSPATVEISAIVPGSRVSPKMTVTLRANEFRQLNSVFAQMNLHEVYNGRITVRVIDGSGRVTGYGSAVDNVTQDPTYIPGQ